MKRNALIAMILTAVLACVGCTSVIPSVTAPTTVSVKSSVADSSPVLSRDVPAYASSGNAQDADNGNYDTPWWSDTTQAWLAYDLSGVPQARRNTVLLVWYNPSFDYDNTLISTYSYNVPENYTIDVNAAAGGGDPPREGWRTEVSVTGNHYHSRQHVIDMQGDNWIRINVTTVDGASENYNVRIKMDIYDARYARSDDWIFYGDSITALSMVNYTTGGEPGFAELIHNRLPNQFPIQENGGIGYLTSADGAKYLPAWLAVFPGKYVALSYGTNDALGCADPTTVRNNYVAMVQDVLKAGKIPVIPQIPWGRESNLQTCVPLLNAEIDALYKAFPQIIRGPDLWSFFNSHQSLISSDNIHPTDLGTAAYRQQWVNAMLAEVYR